MARPTVEPMHDKVLYRLTWLAAALSAIADIMKASPNPSTPALRAARPPQSA
jgi:hypothetical protein